MPTLRELSDMTGRRVLITGGAGHLGRVMAETLAELGADIILLDRHGADFKEIKSNLTNKWNVKCVTIECDLELEDERNQAIRKIKSDGIGLDSLINNAAFVGDSNLQGWVTPFEEQSIDIWRRALEVNLTAPFHLCHAFMDELSSAPDGNIINITSIYGQSGPDWSLYEGTSMGNPAAYSVSKGGLAQMTRWLATTLAPDVRVNAISPGGVFRNQPEIFVSRYEERTPVGRMASVEDFKGATAFLASSLSSYVTGQVLTVDGGWTVW